MILIGMTGPIGHGKTTFSNALAELEPNYCHLETSLVVSEVANAMHAALGQHIPDPYDVKSINLWLQSLPAILLQILGVKCNIEQLQLNEESIQTHPVEYQKLILHLENLQREPHLAVTEITQDNKDNFRPFLQWLGGYLVEKVDSSIWYNELAKRIRAEQQKECELCIVGGVRYPSDAAILRSMGAKIIKVYRPGHLQSDVLDPTERERDNIQVDATIMSNGTVEELKRCAAKFFSDLKSDNLQKLYQTKIS